MMATGIGISYRPEFEVFLEALIGAVDVVEVIPDEIDQLGHKPTISRLSERTPILAHTIGLSVASARLERSERLLELRRFLDQFQINDVSDHLTFTESKSGVAGAFLPPYQDEHWVDACAKAIDQIQIGLGRVLSLENPVTFLSWPGTPKGCATFLAEVSRRTGCCCLLDVTNLFINSVNQGFCPYEFMEEIEAVPVRCMHIAGHSAVGDLLIDSHAAPISDEVLSLASYALRKFKPSSLVLERDNYFGDGSDLLEELRKLRRIWEEIS